MIMPITAPANYHPKKKPSAKSKSRPFQHVLPFKQVYQFKVALKDVEPVIWRRIQVPDYYTFWDLHCAITDVFGWLDYHLHRFTVNNPKSRQWEAIGIPDKEGFDDDKVLPGWKKKIANYFSVQHPDCDYNYDFGDDWHHSIVLESILPKEAGASYPRCIAGENACPPEDSAGVGGYQNFLQIIADPKDEEHESMLDWVGGWFDAAWFDLSLIRFEDPDLRYAVAFNQKPVPKSFRMVQYHRLRKEKP